MEELNKIKIFNKYDEGGLKKEYLESLKDKSFEDYVRTIHLPHEVLMKYTQRLVECNKERNNCLNCKGLKYCKNEIYGSCLKERLENNNLIFEYVNCRYKTKELKVDNKNVYVFDIPKEIKNAKMKDIYTSDDNRTELIKWLIKFIKDYRNGKPVKGLYLSGNFGSGKSYLVSAMINELIKDGYKGALVYYPEFLRSLKASFGKDFDEQFNYAKKADLLLLDDIGAENVSAWSRDEILGPIIQYRMDEKLPTFFTSNLSLEELDIHLSHSKDKIDKIKSKRIIERIRFITDDLKLISENNRK